MLALKMWNKDGTVAWWRGPGLSGPLKPGWARGCWGPGGERWPGGACGPKQDPLPPGRPGPVAVMTTSGAPPGAVGWRLAFQTFQWKAQSPWSLSVTGPPRPLPQGRALDPRSHAESLQPEATFQLPGAGRAGHRRGARVLSAAAPAAQLPRPAAPALLASHVWPCLL